jgi:acyl carrier protein
MQTIENKIIEELSIILNLSPADIDPEALLPELGLDSLLFVELLVFIESEFNLKLIETDLTREDFQTVRSIATCIHKLA